MVAVISLVICSGEVYPVDQFVIHIDRHQTFVPVHMPYVEFLCPILILVSEVREGSDRLIPYGFPALLVAPASVGKNGRAVVLDVIFQYVDLTIVWPFPLVAK